MTMLTSKDQDGTWGCKQCHSFETLKQRLVASTSQHYKNFQLHTDWGALSLGAVLTQKDDVRQDYVIAYASCNNNKVESNYSSYEGKALAMVWAISHFKPYLYEQRFTLMTDHQPLKYFIESDNLTGKFSI